MVANVIPVEAFDLVVFGATGDLARRKLIPALYHRFHDGQMPPEARIIGAARTEMTDEAFRNSASAALDEFIPSGQLDGSKRAAFLSCLHYVRVDAMSDAGWSDLEAKLGETDARPTAFYMSVAPRFFEPVAQRIHDMELGGPDSRLVVEKPLGHDLASARELNRFLSGCFDESRIYRIDHYLGKETVQNLMALRFANALFEPLWNSHHIDHVQITAAESVGTAGRGPYYDGIGAMRDMVQNHLLQLLCLVAMEPPSQFKPDAVRDEKLKVLRSLTPMADLKDLVRGQYRAGPDGGSYLEDAETDHSTTETFVAAKVGIENWRWAGVPFYLRTGKRLRTRSSEIAVQFKDTPHSIFRGTAHPGPNVLSIRLQPNEGITLGMTIKDPGPGGMRLTTAEMDMTFAQTMGAKQMRMPDAYERLVMDVIRGDQTLFMRGDEVEAAWEWIDPIIKDWEKAGDQPQTYEPGSDGPKAAERLIARDDREWREIR